MSKTEEEILFIPYTHIKEAPKINVISMAKLMQAYNFWLKIPKDKFQIIQKISGLTDTGCFMLDELQSLCEPRKAIGMHQAVDSIPSTINAANYAGCNALEKCLELDHSKAGSIYIEQMMQFYRGQGSEIYCRDNYVCPTEEEYRKMCIRKKGSNYQITVQLMQLFSSSTCDFTKLTDILAQFFQIYEDYVLLCTKEQVWGGNCFEEGTFSFPIIHAIRSHPGDNQIVNVLKQKPKGNQMKLYITTLLEKFGSFEYTKQEILRLRDEIEEEMGKFDENPYMIQLIESSLLQPFVHIARIPGKKVRSKLCQALNNWMHIPEEKLRQIEDVLEMLHNASLLLDDIQDDSILRRSVPTAHSIYGVSRTVNSANYAAFVTFEKVLDIGDPKGIQITIEKCLDLYRGQGMELYWRDNFICPTLDEYKLMCIRKTGGLFLLAIQLIQLFSDVKDDFTKFGESVGLFFQIRDDYMNLCSKEYTISKTFCDDLTEGKFSFPVIHAIQTHPEDKRVINILKQKTRDVAVKKQCLSILKKFGSLDYTKEVLLKLKEEIIHEVSLLPENPMIIHLLDHVLKLD
ncbi:unnamed protein product [Tenebrio molitor]|nr:unnamed protein product [Tenebrio molitor]